MTTDQQRAETIAKMSRPLHWATVSTEARDCAKHGTYEAQCQQLQGSPVPSVSWTSCPVCDAELQREVDRHEAEIRDGVTMKVRLLNERLANAGIPLRFRQSTLWNWQHGPDHMRKAWGTVRDYASAFETALETGRSMVIVGGPGTGKTHIAIGVLRHVLEKGGTGRYATVFEMLARIKETYSQKSGETERQAFEAFALPDIVVIDEVGKQLDTRYDQAQLFRLLDYRYQNMKPTILVSNMPKGELLTFLGEAALDRLREAGGALLVFDWVSQRNYKRITNGDES